MGYVEEHLLAGERVRYRAHLHKLIYVLPGLFTLVFTLGAVWAYLADLVWPALALFVVGCIPLLITHIKYVTSEFAVTDKRVIIKVGWIRRRTLETMLSKVEAIGVDQGIFGRMLGFGTITITGTGGTKEQFADIAHPLEFRRQVQGQVSASEEARNVQSPSVGALGASAPREERDCPFCAERILVRAKLCKHCGRSVEPLTAP